jgi:hypothetical protein
MSKQNKPKTAAAAPEAPQAKENLFYQPITPGQWHFDEQTLIVTAGKSPGSPYVADCRFGDLVHRAPNARLIASAPRLRATAAKLAKALRRAKQDLAEIQRDCNEGEFEIDPQFAIDRISAALAEWEEGAQLGE